MKTFPVKFSARNLSLDAIVTMLDNHQKFKVEMVTGEPDPVILHHHPAGHWTIERSGQRNFSAEVFEALQQAISAHLDKIYSAKNILVLTDFSLSALNAVEYAAQLTHQLNTSSILLYHSHRHLPAITTAFAPPVSILSEKEGTDKLLHLKDTATKLCRPGTAVNILADGRSLVSAVNILVEQQLMGLVVMGITGKSFFEKTLAGSNTVTVVKECSVPVLVIPNGISWQTIKKVVLACDLKKVSATIPVHPIKSFVQALGAGLLILYVNHTNGKPEQGAQEELHLLHEIWDDQNPEYHYSDHENIEQGIMDFADDNDVDLIITISKEYGFLEGIFHRSLTRSLTYKTHIPLLTFRENI